MTRYCQSTVFDYEKSQAAPLHYDLAYSDEEIWDTFTYFIKRVMPVAEESGVKITMETDKSISQCCGIPYIFRSFDSAAYRCSRILYDRIFVSLCLCHCSTVTLKSDNTALAGSWMILSPMSTSHINGSHVDQIVRSPFSPASRCRC